jgi:hypothetical protein
VLYCYETQSLTLREEWRLRVFENTIPRQIFGPKRDENGELRKFHKEELYRLYRSPNILRVIKCRIFRWAGHVARMEEGRSAFAILTDAPTGKRPLERFRPRWEGNIVVDYKELGMNTRNWVDSAQK